MVKTTRPGKKSPARPPAAQLPSHPFRSFSGLTLVKIPRGELARANLRGRGKFVEDSDWGDWLDRLTKEWRSRIGGFLGRLTISEFYPSSSSPKFALSDPNSGVEFALSFGTHDAPRRSVAAIIDDLFDVIQKWLKRSNSEKTRSESRFVVRTYYRSEEYDEIISTAFTAAKGLNQEQDRASAIVKLVPDLSRDQLSEVISLFAAGGDRDWWALMAVTPYLDTLEQYSVAFRAIIRNARSDDDCAGAIVKLESFFPTELMGEIINAANKFESEKARVQILSAIASSLTAKQLDDIIASIDKVEVGTNRAYLLRGVSEYLEPEQTKRALVAADGIGDPILRDEIIKELMLLGRTAKAGHFVSRDNFVERDGVAGTMRSEGIEPWDGVVSGTETLTTDEVQDQQTEISNDQILDALANRGVSPDLHRQVAAALVLGGRLRPQWNERTKYEELAHLNAPRFLKAVYADLLDAEGDLKNEEAVRLSDPTLVQVVQTYINERIRGRRGPGDAKGLAFAKKDNRGRPKKATKRHSRRGLSLG